jgi:hypothetical protein
MAMEERTSFMTFQSPGKAQSKSRGQTVWNTLVCSTLNLPKDKKRQKMQTSMGVVE